jgi:hypothetical protein
VNSAGPDQVRVAESSATRVKPRHPGHVPALPAEADWQASGGEVVELLPGDAIWAPPGERHWHGAAPGHDFASTSIQPIDPDTGAHADY